MAPTYGKLEHQITVPTGGWTATVGGATATIPAGTYYQSSPGSRASDFLAEVATQFAAAAATSCTVTAPLGEAGTGIVTIVFGAARTIAWVSTDLRDLLGFAADSASATNHVSTKSARGVWMPTTAYWNKNGGGDWRGRVRADYRSSANAAGHVFAMMGQKRYELELRWGAVKRERMWITSETTANQSLERFWRDGIWGEASWGTPGGPLRWHPDAASDSVYGTYRVIDADTYDPAQAMTDYVGSWAVQMPLMIQVPGTESLGLVGGRATIGVSLLTVSSSTVDGTVFTTASVAPGANRALYLFVHSAAAATASAPTSVTGNGLTWVLEESQSLGTPRYLSVFRAMGAAPSAGAITITHSASHTSCAWALVECANTDTTGSSASGATVQSVPMVNTGTVTTETNTLAALENATNVHLCCVGLNIASTVTPDADFVELGDDSETAGNITIEVQWAANQTVCTSTFASAAVAMISVEVKSGAA